jgi:molybdate transport system substrate-binding protein
MQESTLLALQNMRVLACTVPLAEKRLRAVLPDARLQVVLTSDEALEALRQEAFDLLILGMRFDESRGLEFLQRIHADATLSPLPPLVGIRGAASPVVIAPQHFDLPMWAMGACDVIDFYAVPDNDAGNRHIRERLLRCSRMRGVRVLSSLALKGVLEKFRAQFERALGPLELRFDATQAILPAVRRGEAADLLILTQEAMEELQASGAVTQAWPLASSGIGVAVRAGAPKPDLASVEALKSALLSARSVAHSKVGASGIYFSALLERLGIAQQLKKRIVVEKGPVGLAVAAGEAELGVQQLCELAPVPGIEIAGPLPGPLQKLTWFSAGIPASAANAEGARALVELLRSDAARRGMAEGGLQP